MNVEPAWKTYLMVVVALIPTLFFWLFSLMVNFPKIESVWRKAGLSVDGKQAPTAILGFIMGLSRFAFSNFYFIIYGVLAILIVLELWVTSWPRIRRPACVITAVLL